MPSWGPGATNEEHFHFSLGEFRDHPAFLLLLPEAEKEIFPIWFWTTFVFDFHSYSIGVRLGWEFMEEWVWEIPAYDTGHQWAPWKSKLWGVSEEFIQATLPVPTKAPVRSRVPSVPWRTKEQWRNEKKISLPSNSRFSWVPELWESRGWWINYSWLLVIVENWCYTRATWEFKGDLWINGLRAEQKYK